MAMYSYKGLDKTGKEIKSNISAESLSQAKSKLRSSGIMLIDIKAQKSEKQKKGQLTFGSGINTEALSLMTRQLATLVKAKIQIVEAFNALIDQSENPKLKVILAEIRQKVNEGTSLAQALADYPKVFSNVYVNMVEAGEASGNLEVVLLRLADFTEAQVKLKRKIKGAMMYPVLMASMGMLMMSAIFIFVIPKITKIFISMKKELPLPTKVCIWISDFLQNWWWAIPIGIFLAYWLFNKWKASPKGESTWHGIVLKLPIAGKLVQMINVSRFSSTLATLLDSGVPILSAMRIVKNLIGNVHMQKAVEQARSNIQEGASMTPPLVESGHFPTMVTHMIKLGESSGEIEPMLRIVAENYEDQVEANLSGLTSTLEPIMIVGMGIAVAFIVFSVVIPMMELNTLS
ncbi:MAG: type II secretion system protein GspF [Halobacteriovorax sp.]|nr:type II secretion system protein GspF [Halobacteriovorax sp.]|tara:strand:- start:39798 stop:41006 length:1209 start_codon:yes stop_codon:yes gene_type:complete